MLNKALLFSGLFFGVVHTCTHTNTNKKIQLKQTLTYYSIHKARNMVMENCLCGQGVLLHLSAHCYLADIPGQPEHGRYEVPCKPGENSH